MIKGTPNEKGQANNGRSAKNQQSSPQGPHKSFSPEKKSAGNFDEYYDKYCVGFLKRREKELAKRRQEKEEQELAELKDKPTLITRNNDKKHIPLLQRTPILNARREKQIEKMREEKNAKIEKEFSELTFKPKLNEKSLALASPRRENIRTKSPSKAPEDGFFKPKIDKNSEALAVNYFSYLKIFNHQL